MNRFIKAHIYCFIALAFTACNVEETQKPNKDLHFNTLFGTKMNLWYISIPFLEQN